MSPQPITPAPTVAAVLLPGERAHVEAAGNGCFRVVHRDSVPEALTVVRERAVDAVLVSVHRCSATTDAAAVRRLVSAFPGLPAVALLSRHDSDTPSALLQLGACGVSEVVDVTRPTGWGRLRHLLTQPTSRPAARILGPLLEGLPGLPPDPRTFLEAMVKLAPATPTVRALAREFGIRPSTLMSRFTRAGLPSVKRYLAALRLLYAAQYFENGGLSIADVAYRLDCSSPQSFGRHVRSLLGVTCSEFRGRFPFPVALTRFLELLVEPYRERWLTFHPVSPGASIGAGHRWRAPAPGRRAP